MSHLKEIETTAHAEVKNMVKKMQVSVPAVPDGRKCAQSPGPNPKPNPKEQEG